MAARQRDGDGAAELHAGRLRMLCEKLVDTPVRGLLYEGAGSLGEVCWPAAPRSCGERR